jgi:hypothetical protein
MAAGCGRGWSGPWEMSASRARWRRAYGQRTCTFGPVAMHALQRVHGARNACAHDREIILPPRLARDALDGIQYVGSKTKITSNRLGDSWRNECLVKDRGQPVVGCLPLNLGDSRWRGLGIRTETADPYLGQVIPHRQIAESSVSGDELGSSAARQALAERPVKTAGNGRSATILLVSMTSEAPLCTTASSTAGWKPYW